MGRRKKGRCVKKNKQINSEESPDVIKAPHSFVIHRGLPGEYIVELTKDFRKIMEPFTAMSLKERKKNTIKDFVSIASVFHITHMCIFTKTEQGMYFKLCRLPRGPTLTFKIHSFSLSRDVISLLKKQMVYEELFKNSPLVILNNFSGEGMQLKLIASMFQNMFPTINLTSVNLSTIRRCLNLNYNSISKTIDLRHYAIKVVPVDVSKGVKKLIQAKIPNLSKCEDFSDFLTKGTISESEAEDDPSSHVTLPQTLSSRGNHANSKSAIKIFELGPRLKIELIKVEDGVLDGEVLFHEYIYKSEEEKQLIKKKREAKKKLKEKRKKIQEENKKKKELQKQEHKEKSLKGMQKKKENEILLQKLAKESVMENNIEDDDIQYYRDEIGEEPDKDLFERKVGEKRRRSISKYEVKKQKLDKS
ncbi:protein Peter pan [Frieseomelitta varia]|uniref:protein Peter pan n=1 Tax=Frieseomelitta varia TaxID=561572 RepID=UPI001CB6ACFC|nr:protein Peter pan [Frieseomelitta varia]